MVLLKSFLIAIAERVSQLPWEQQTHVCQQREESPRIPAESTLAVSSASGSTSQDHLLVLNPLPLRHSTPSPPDLPLHYKKQLY